MPSRFVHVKLPLVYVSHVTEYLIEQWVRNPEALSPEQRQAVRDGLAGSAEAQAAVQFWQSFFSSSEVLQKTVSARVQRFVDTLFTPPAHLTLTPLAAEVAEAAVLHAQTTTDAGGRFRCLATLVHEGQSMVVRLLHDAEAPEAAYRLYVLADDPSLTAHALVHLPALDRTVQTDASGRAVFGLASPPPAEALTEATAHCLLGTIPANAGHEAGTHTLGAGATVRLSPTEGQLVVQVRTEAKAVTIDRVVVGPDDPPHMVSLASGHARLPLAAAKQPLYFYG